MNPAQNESRIAEQLMVLPTAPERLQYLVDRSKNLPPWPEEERERAARVAGCQAEVWLVASRQEGLWNFRADSTAPMVKALAALLCEIFSGSSSAEAARFEPSVLQDSGIFRNLTPTRQQGVARITAAIRALVTATDTPDRRDR